MTDGDFETADELEAFLTARQSGQELPAPPGLPAEDAALADALLRLADEIQPDPLFAAELEARLRARAATTIASRQVATASRPNWRRLAALAAPLAQPARRSRWPALIAAALILALLAVPPARAAVLSLLRIGAVRISLSQPTALAPPTPLVPTAPVPTSLGSTLDLAGETTLAEALRKAGFPIRLPSWPADLGPPDRVYLQDLGGQAVILVWIDRQQPSRVRLSLHQLGPGIAVLKNQPPAIEHTMVLGQPAVWTSGPYMLEVQPSTATEHKQAARRLVAGHTLVWTEGELTYRLETDQPLAEAVRIAESLR